MMPREIDECHKLPCDFAVGRTLFRKGVTLETVRLAAERWWRQAAITHPMNKGVPKYDLEEMVSRITEENRPKEEF